MADWDAALAAADVRVLLMSVFHLTGDERWLADPYRPARDVRLVADPEAGLPPAVATEIRSVARDLLEAGTQPVVTDPDPELFGRMMSWCLGEQVPPEYVPMMRTDLGFADGDVHWTDGPPPDLDLDVLVIGAGVSGLCLAAKLDHLGIPVRVVERRDSVGGTWRDNRYPGCGVDTPNHFYSYSFAPNPHWRHYFSPREEIEAYLADCADRLGVSDLVTLGTEVVEARWDKTSARWQVALRGPDGDTTTSAAVLVAAAGHFGSPNEVPFPGLDDFAGRSFHTARWPDEVDLAGRRVAVVGTGASAMQVVPEIAADVEHLAVFQRTPQWARHVPLYDAAVDPAAHRLFEQVPYYDRWYRFAQAWRYGDGLLRFLRKDPDWPHPERSLNRTNDRHRREMTDHLLAGLDGRPDLVAKCLPDYPPFGKRILIDNGWFRTLRRPNVSLVTEPIDRIEPDGIRTGDGDLHPVDVIVQATGFRVTDLGNRLHLVGRDGLTLAEAWADDDPTAHLGITVPGFPNLFVMYGPNTNAGHGGSIMWLAETQSRYIAAALRLLAEGGHRSMEVRPEVCEAWTAHVDERHEELVWTHPGVTTYYRNGAGKVRSPMPIRLVDYWQLTREPDPAEFVLG